MELLVGFAIAVVIYLFIKAKSSSLSSDDAKSLVKDGALLIDVRSPAEFKQGHIKGAKNIPLNEIASRTKEIGKVEQAVVLYCRSGSRSSGAMRILKSNGFLNVNNLGAMSKW